MTHPSRAPFRRLVFVVFLLTTMNCFGVARKAMAEEKPNIVFIAIDDMNDWVGFLGGHPQAKTPNMDRLAKLGTNFTNAHCVAPACSPSRLALLYGVQPFHSGFYPFYNHREISKQKLSQYKSLPALFRDNGYQTFGAGKIFHGYQDRDEHWNDYLKPKNVKLKYDADAGYRIGKSRKMAFCPTTNPLEDHPDYQVADYGIDVIRRSHDKPFFVGVGIVKPHLPFVCPKRFFDMQDEEITKPPLRYRDLNDIPDVGRSMAKLSDDYRFRTDKAWQRVRRAYLACNSWVDYNVGRVIAAVEASEHADNTIIVLWSDHGYHMGEKRSFRKFSLWEESTRVPFIIYDLRPGKQNAGNCSEAVSLIHVYRTLADLSGIACPEYVDGVSLIPQLKNAEQSVSEPAITTWGRGNFTIRDKDFRYTRYFDGGEELYDHRKDPMEWENRQDDEAYAKIKAQLAKHVPDKPAALAKQGVALWNVIDADRPGKLKTFVKETWPKMKKKLVPKIESP